MNIAPLEAKSKGAYRVNHVDAAPEVGTSYLLPSPLWKARYRTEPTEQADALLPRL